MGVGIRACPNGGPPRCGAAFRTGSPSRIGPFQPLDAELRIIGVSPIVENYSFKGRLTPPDRLARKLSPPVMVGVTFASILASLLSEPGKFPQVARRITRL